jgi:cytochrome P450
LKPGTTLNILPEMRTLTAEIIFRTLFGNPLGTQQAEEIIQSFAQYQAAIEQIDSGTFFGLPTWAPTMKWGKAKTAATRIHKIVENLIVEGIKSDNQGTLLAHLLRLREGKANDALTMKEVRNELIVLFMAGHETTANTLAWAWYLISQAPEVEQQLHTEVDQVLASDSAQFKDCSNLTYTRAIIDETLRLYPPFPLLSREVSNDDTIRKRDIPAGSIMLVVPWLLHRHELYWDKPNHFIPERFLPTAEKKPEQFAYVPFSLGPRVYIAKFFGTVETSLCLSILAKNFRLTLPQGTQVTHDCRLTLRPKGNLPMKIIPRLR